MAKRSVFAFWRALTAAALAGAAMLPSSASADGGPDAWGYVWYNDPAAIPGVGAWVDISGDGMVVDGLGDDNASAVLDMGFGFTWYWTTQQQVRIGANGWMSFDATGTEAPCFGLLPTAGGLDNIIAPFMADLTLAGAGNPGRVLVRSRPMEGEWIVTWDQVPWKDPGAPDGWSGSHTFQAHLYRNGRIVFRYLAMSFDLPPSSSAGCGTFTSGGIENMTGNIGLEWFANSVPGPSSFVVFEPPSSPTFVFADLTPEWVGQTGNGALISEVGVSESLLTSVYHVGSIPADRTTTLQARLKLGTDPDLVLSTLSVPPMLPGGRELVTLLDYTLPAPGSYSLRTALSNPDDVNPSNNSVITEILGISWGGEPIRVSYQSGVGTTGSTAMFTGGRVFTYFAVPGGSIEVVSVDGIPVITGDISTAAVVVEVLDNDGPNGGPGTVLGRQEGLSTASFGADGWASIALAEPVTVADGEFYVSFSSNTSSLSLATESTEPFSRQNWEDLNGLQPWRDVERGEILLGAKVRPTPTDPGGGDTGVSDAGSDAGTADIGVSDAGGDTGVTDAGTSDVVDDTGAGTDAAADIGGDAETDGTPDDSGPTDDTTDPDGQGGGEDSTDDTTGATDTPTAEDGTAPGPDSGGNADTGVLTDAGTDGSASEGSDDDESGTGGGGGGGGCTTAPASATGAMPGAALAWGLSLLAWALPRRRRVVASRATVPGGR